MLWDQHQGLKWWGLLNLKIEESIMTEKLTPLNNTPLIPQESFDEPDEPKSNTRALDHRAYVTLESSYGVHLVCPSELSPAKQFTRFGLLVDPHLYIDTPIIGLPTDISFGLIGTFETSLDGKSLRGGGGAEIQFGLAPVFQAYLRNSAIYFSDEETTRWQVEGGVRVPALIYEGPLLLGIQLGFGGYLLEPPNGYFTAGLNASF